MTIDLKITKKIFDTYFKFFSELNDSVEFYDKDLKHFVEKLKSSNHHTYLNELGEELKLALLNLNCDKDRYRLLNMIVDKFNLASIDILLFNNRYKLEKLHDRHMLNIESIIHEDLSDTINMGLQSKIDFDKLVIDEFDVEEFCLYKIKLLIIEIFKIIKTIFDYFELDYCSFVTNKFKNCDEYFYKYFYSEIVMNKNIIDNSINIPEIEISIIEKNKEMAKEFLKFFNGNNFLKQKIMSDKDFERLMEYTYYLIEYESLPKEINPLPHINISVEFIRKTYEQLHKRLYGKKKRQYWIDFLHEFFTQFESWDKETTNKNFATYRGQYEEDLKKLRS